MNKLKLMILTVIFSLSGCATDNIPKEQLGNYGVVKARIGDSSDVTEMDGKHAHGSVNVEPGEHRVEVYVCGSSTSSCRPVYFTLQVEAGNAYIIRNTSIIDVYNRFDLNNKTGSLVPGADGVFMNSQVVAEFRNEQQRNKNEMAARAKEVTNKIRSANLPLVRKVGAKICQKARDWIKVGYVEGMSEEKVQIRVSNMYVPGNPNLHPGGFVESIIWDSPMNWDLCEG